MDPDSGSSVTLIYYRIGERWWKEPFLNVVAAAAQMSSLTHVEIAIGGNNSRIAHPARNRILTIRVRVSRRGAGKQWDDDECLQSLQRQGVSRAHSHVDSTSDLLIGMRRMCTQVGVELVERTGRSPHYVYQSLGCSKAAVARMLRYAKTQCVGKPFSNTGMARSLLWPRQTDGTSFFCAGT